MRKSLVLDLITLALFVLLLAYTAQVYASLPERIPTHFGIDGRPNSWMPRELGAWVLPGFAVLLTLILRVAPAFADSAKRALVELPLRIIGAVLIATLGATQVLMLDAATSPDHKISNLIWIPALFGIVGIPLILAKTTPRPA
jgi:uncharacterized membrane protein